MEPDPLVGRTIAGRYWVEAEVGRGAMGVVYRAHDEKHGRDVVLKVLDPEVARDVGSERFLREIQTAARLSHPHIVPLHDSGSSDGVLYYVMPLIEGQTQREWIVNDPDWDSVSDDPRFAKILSQVGPQPLPGQQGGLPTQ